MKVTTTRDKEEFKPRTTTITFESEEEYYYFRKIMGHSLTIPEMLCYTKGDEKRMNTMMVSIFQTMPELP